MGEIMNGWEFEKKISIGDLIAFVMALIAVIYAYSTLDKRVAVLEAATIAREANDARQDMERASLRQEIRQDLSDIKTDIREVRKAVTKK